MGNFLSLAKEWKAFLQEIPKILAAFVEAILGATRTLQDLEEIYIELKELSDLLELLKSTCKDNERQILQQKARSLMESTKNKLYHNALQGTQLSEALKNVEAMIITLASTAKQDSEVKESKNVSR